MSDNEIQYGGRDPMMLDRAGGYYQRHVNAMTAERLHEKSDIAAELGYRDMMVDQLRARVAELEAENERLRVALQKIKALEHPNVGGGFCHWEGCESPLIAGKALSGDKSA